MGAAHNSTRKRRYNTDTKAAASNLQYFISGNHVDVSLIMDFKRASNTKKAVPELAVWFRREDIGTPPLYQSFLVLVLHS